MEPYPPLATLYAASVLRDAGVSVNVHDTVFDADTSNVCRAIAQHAGETVVIYDDGFNYLTKMCLVNMRNACFDMIRTAKQNNCRVLVSGSDATDHCLDYLQAGADCIIIGEAEITLLELIQGNNPLASILGIAYLEEGNLHYTAKRPVLHDLDSLPLPAWDLIDLAPYRNAWKKSQGRFSINITTTRGCPFKCNWCAKPIYGNRYNSRSPEQVVEEIRLLVQSYGAEHVWFCDDIFGLKPGWIKQFSLLMQQQSFRIQYKIQCRADVLLNEENIAFLAASGCDEIWIGAESGSQKILDAMDKGTTIDQIVSSTALMKKHGIKPCFFLQFGYPGEEMADIKKTIEMLADCMPFDIGISISYPLPGTVFYERVRAELSAKQNWNDSDELLLMYHGTYAAGFYKNLHRYVHQYFRLLQGWMGMKQRLGLRGNYWHMSWRRIIATPYHAISACFYRLRMQMSK